MKKSIIDSETSRRVSYARAGVALFRGRVHEPCDCRRKSCKGYTVALTARVYSYDGAVEAARRLAAFVGAPLSAALPWPAWGFDCARSNPAAGAVGAYGGAS